MKFKTLYLLAILFWHDALYAKNCFDSLSKSLIQTEYAQRFNAYKLKDAHILELENQHLWISKNDSPCPEFLSFNPTSDKLASLSSTHIGYLQEINALNFLVAVGSKTSIYNQQVREKISQGKVMELGVIPSKERLLLSGAQLLLSDDFMQVNNSPIKSVNIFDHYESDPLARVEWLVVFGILTGKKDLAMSRIKEIKENFQALEDRKENKNLKSFITGSFRGGSFEASGSKSALVGMIVRAGGKYHFYDQNDSERIKRLRGEEVLLGLSEDIAYWFPLSLHTSKKELLSESRYYKLSKAFKNAEIYNFNKKMRDDGANEFWERSPVRPDKVLSDLVCLFHRNKCEFHWLEKLK